MKMQMISIKECENPPQMAIGEPEYTVCEEPATLGEISMITYGVGVTMINRDGERESAYAPSLFTNKNEAMEYANKLLRGGVTPMSLLYIVEDDFGIEVTE